MCRKSDMDRFMYINYTCEHAYHYDTTFFTCLISTYVFWVNHYEINSTFIHHHVSPPLLSWWSFKKRGKSKFNNDVCRKLTLNLLRQMIYEVLARCLYLTMYLISEGILWVLVRLRIFKYTNEFYWDTKLFVNKETKSFVSQ